MKGKISDIDIAIRDEFSKICAKQGAKPAMRPLGGSNLEGIGGDGGDRFENAQELSDFEQNSSEDQCPEPAMAHLLARQGCAEESLAEAMPPPAGLIPAGNSPA